MSKRDYIFDLDSISQNNTLRINSTYLSKGVEAKKAAFYDIELEYGNVKYYDFVIMNPRKFIKEYIDVELPVLDIKYCYYSPRRFSTILLKTFRYRI